MSGDLTGLCLCITYYSGDLNNKPVRYSNGPNLVDHVDGFSLLSNNQFFPLFLMKIK